MAISYAGVDLPVWTSECAAWAERTLKMRDFFPFNLNADSVAEYDFLPLPILPADSGSPPVGRLVWPSGASSWGYAFYPVSSEQLDDIRDLVGEGNTPQSLVITDGTGAEITVADMRMLTPYPVAGSGDLYLLPLVDQRYWWWFKTVGFNTQPGTWPTVLNAIATALGVTFTGDTTVNAAYWFPSARWFVDGIPACLLLDAWAATVGKRVSVLYDGTVKIENASTAQTQASTSYQTHLDRLMAGGLCASGDIGRSVPASVSVLFGGNQEGRYYNVDYALSDLLPTGLVYGYPSGATGVSGYKARIVGDTIATGTWSTPTGNISPVNLSTLTGYARQASADWYSWRAGWVDAAYAGTTDYTPDGTAYVIEHEYNQGDVSVRVRPHPVWDINTYGYRNEGYGDGWFARLTGSQNSGGSWVYSWQERYKQTAISESDGPRSGYLNAQSAAPWMWVQIPTGTNRTGTKVWMWKTQGGFYNFIPVDRWRAETITEVDDYVYALTCNPAASGDSISMGYSRIETDSNGVPVNSSTSGSSHTFTLYTQTITSLDKVTVNATNTSGGEVEINGGDYVDVNAADEITLTAGDTVVESDLWVNGRTGTTNPYARIFGVTSEAMQLRIDNNGTGPTSLHEFCTLDAGRLLITNDETGDPPSFSATSDDAILYNPSVTTFGGIPATVTLTQGQIYCTAGTDPFAKIIGPADIGGYCLQLYGGPSYSRAFIGSDNVAQFGDPSVYNPAQPTIGYQFGYQKQKAAALGHVVQGATDGTSSTHATIEYTTTQYYETGVSEYTYSTKIQAINAPGDRAIDVKRSGSDLFYVTNEGDVYIYGDISVTGDIGLGGGINGGSVDGGTF